jgi:hypothetical protein
VVQRIAARPGSDVPRRPRTVPPAGWDLVAAGCAAALVAVAFVVGVWLDRLDLPGERIYAAAAPLFASWLPHVGPGTPLALLVALAVVTRGPELAARLPWRRALPLGYLAAVSWTFSLALVDGWQRGVVSRLLNGHEYLHEVPGVTGIGAMLHGFASRILDYQPDSWTTHVAGHPPGALLVFVWLDRIGLGGGAWAGVACMLVGCLAAVAVPVTLRALGADWTARAALPFVVLFPGAVWVGVSADGLFTGVTASGVALLAVGGRALARRAAVATGDAVGTEPAGVPGSRAVGPGDPRPGAVGPGLGGEATGEPARAARDTVVWGSLACVAGGVALGFGAFLSYGLVLMAPVALAVVLLTGRWRVALLGCCGALAVLLGFALAGFWWPNGYHLVVQRYYQGIGAERWYAYWVWGDLAALALATGPAAVAGVRRAAALAVRRLGAARPVASWRFAARSAGPRSFAARLLGARLLGARVSGALSPGARLLGGDGGVRPDWLVVAGLAGAAAAAVLAADLSGLSKAEVERIWLPFAVWLTSASALLPATSRRPWLAAQAVTALAVNHLLLTNW